jgi:hypothetical protein
MLFTLMGKARAESRELPLASLLSEVGNFLKINEFSPDDIFPE